MRTKQSVFGILTIGTALLVVCSTTAKGSSISYVAAGQEDMGADSQFSGSLSIPQFNPSLGVLNSIDLVFGSAYGSRIAVSGADTDRPIDSLDVMESTTFRDAGNNINVTIGNIWTSYAHYQDPGWRFDLSGSSSPGEILGGFNGAGIPSEFIGTGSFSLGVAATQEISTGIFVPPGFSASIVDGYFGADVWITYNYTDTIDSNASPSVPDKPNSLSLLALSFGLILFAQKTLRKEYRAGSCN